MSGEPLSTAEESLIRALAGGINTPGCSWRDYVCADHPRIRSVFHAWEAHKALRADRVFRPDVARDVMAMRFNWHSLRDHGGDPAALGVLDYVYDKGRNEPSIPIAFAAKSAVVGGGPKLYFPAADDCRSMQHVTLNVPKAAYRQPFPALVVVVPPEFGAGLGVDLHGGPQQPTLLTVVHYEAVGWLSLCVVYTGGSHYSCEIDLLDAPDRPIEADLTGLGYVYGAMDRDHLRALWRLAFNSCLLMTHYTPVLKGYADPARAKFLADRLAKAKKASPEVRAANRLELDLAAKVYGFEQHIRIYREETPAPREEGGDPSGEPVSPHWRVGHWAMQPYGPGNALRKKIFRRPVFVNAHRFGGRLADTTVHATTR